MITMIRSAEHQTIDVAFNADGVTAKNRRVLHYCINVIAKIKVAHANIFDRNCGVISVNVYPVLFRAAVVDFKLGKISIFANLHVLHAVSQLDAMPLVRLRSTINRQLITNANIGNIVAISPGAMDIDSIALMSTYDN